MAGRKRRVRKSSALRMRREARMNLRASPEQDRLIRVAAEAAGKNLSEFVLGSACAAAENVLADRRLFTVDDAAYRRFLAALDAPAKETPRLAQLLREPSAIERR